MAAISVLVVDDSAFMRKMLTEILQKDAEIVVVGQARDGLDALSKIETLKPNVITLDVEMPQMDGYATLQEIMKKQPIPVVMVSSLTQSGAEMTMKCLAAGAVDFVAKPSGSISLDIDRVAGDIQSKVKIAAQCRKPVFHAPPVKTPRREPQYAPTTTLIREVTQTVAIKTQQYAEATTKYEAPTVHKTEAHQPPAFPAGAPSLIVVGASTGGPRALHAVIPHLPADIGVPIIIVQHMPPGFTESLAKRLDTESAVHVCEAKEGDVLQPNKAYVAPGGRHMVVNANHVLHMTDEPPVHGVRPSVDVTMASIAQVYGGRVIAVLLTGMGKDGAQGMKMLRRLGAHTLAEHESTCVVYGMPKAAADIDGVDKLLPIGDISAAIVNAMIR